MESRYTTSKANLETYQDSDLSHIFECIITINKVNFISKKAIRIDFKGIKLKFIEKI